MDKKISSKINFVKQRFKKDQVQIGRGTVSNTVQMQKGNVDKKMRN